MSENPENMTEMENDIADDVWNTLSYSEMARWDKDSEFRKVLYIKYWNERGYV